MELTAITYGRNSSANQISIDGQNDENVKACGELGARVVAELSDPISASRYATKRRDDWARLLGLVPTIDLVVLWEPSRGDRTLGTWVAFLDLCRLHGTRIHATSHHRTYDPRNARDYRSLAEDGVDSAYESDKTSARVRRGFAMAYAAGRPAGKLDYGYARIYDTRTAPPRYVRQDPHPEQSTVVTRIFAELESGRTLNAVAQGLMRDRIPTQRGAPFWRPNVVRGIASNPIYRPHPDNPERGCLVRTGEIYVGTWPPLVSEATWQSVQRILGTDNADVRQLRQASAPGQVKHLLSASMRLLLAPCGFPVCGQSPRPGRRAHYQCHNEGCVSVPMDEADEFVSRLVVARLSQDDARQLWVADDSASRSALDELARLQAELADARVSFAAPGGISAAALAMKEAAMAPAMADAKRRSEPAEVPFGALRLMDAARVGQDLARPTWDAFPVTAKREVIQGIFASLVLHPATTPINRWTTPDDRLDLVSQRIAYVWRSAS